MKSENFSDVIGLLDDEFLESYNNKKLKRRRNICIKWISVAACFCSLIVASWFIRSEITQKDIQLYKADRSTFLRKDSELFTEITASPIPTVVDVPISTDSPVQTNVPDTTVYALTPRQTHVPNINITPSTTEEPYVNEIKLPENTITEDAFTHKDEKEPITTTSPVEEYVVNGDMMGKAYWEKRWENDWTFFMTLIEEKREKGILSSPSYMTGCGDFGYEGTIDSDESFIIESDWRFDFEYNNGMYLAIKSGITKNDIGTPLGKTTVRALELGIANLEYTKEVDIYEIKSVSSEAAIAVQISNDEYYIFYNDLYSPESLQEFIKDVNIINTSELKQIAFMDTNRYETANAIYDIVSDNEIWNILLKDEGLNDSSFRLDDGGYPIKDNVHISLDNSFYENYDVTYALYDKGGICVRWLNSVYDFKLEKKTVEQIKNLYQ